MPKATPPSFECPLNFSHFESIFRKLADDYARFSVNDAAPALRINAAVASQRKNFEALTIANRVAFEGAQAVVQRQSDQIWDAVKDLAVLSQQLSASGTVEEKLAQQTDMATAAFKTALANFRELARGIQKTSDDVVAVISTRIVDSFDDLCSGLRAKAAAKK